MSEPKTRAFTERLIQNLLSANLSLSDAQTKTIRALCLDYETSNSLKLEEKEIVIAQLKKNVLEVTEKRLRAANRSDADGSSIYQTNSVEYLLSEKTSEIDNLKLECEIKENEIRKFKDIIKEQDDVILSLNQNIFVSI